MIAIGRVKRFQVRKIPGVQNETLSVIVSSSRRFPSKVEISFSLAGNTRSKKHCATTLSRDSWPTTCVKKIGISSRVQIRVQL